MTTAPRFETTRRSIKEIVTNSLHPWDDTESAEGIYQGNRQGLERAMIMSLSKPASGPGHALTRETRAAKIAISAIAISLLTVMPAYSGDPTKLPEIVIGAPPAATTPAPNSAPGSAPASIGHQHCVEGAIGNEPPSLDCLNEKLKRKVDQVNPVLNTPPIDAKSQDLKVGVVNVPAVQQQYGRNFGVSAIPYRPPTPTFAPLGGRR